MRAPRRFVPMGIRARQLRYARMRACYIATCVHCGKEVVAAERFADQEFALLQRHLATAHPHLGNADGTVGILQHYTVRAQ